MKANTRLFVAILLGLAVAPATAQKIVTYEADYTIEYKGREAGESQFAVRREAEDGHFRFVSNSKLRGLVARIVAPKAVIEDSVFRIADGRIEPASFRYEDGSRKGEDNFTIAFARPGSATVRSEAGARDMELVAGALDRGSAQVALMLDAARAGGPPATYEILDDDGIDSYTVTRLEPASTQTRAGEFSAIRYVQQRIGSSRQTVFWLAPELHYLPVRIERIRNGETETVFLLDAVRFDGD